MLRCQQSLPRRVGIINKLESHSNKLEIQTKTTYPQIIHGKWHIQTILTKIIKSLFYKNASRIKWEGIPVLLL